MKRFTDTCKWDDAWFRELPGAHKLVFLYIIDRCDNAGFWEVDEGAVAWHTKLDPKHIPGALKGLERGLKGAAGWVWVKNFLRHQKNDELNEDNPAHRQIIKLLKGQSDRFSECAELEFLLRPMQGATKPSRIGRGKVKEEKGMQGEENSKPDSEAQAMEIYEAYPRKEARPAALKAISKALKKHSFETLLSAANRYAVARAGQDKAFTPHPATWFNEERFMDDPANWSAVKQPQERPNAFNTPLPKTEVRMLPECFKQFLVEHPHFATKEWKTFNELPFSLRDEFEGWQAEHR